MSTEFLAHVQLTPASYPALAVDEHSGRGIGLEVVTSHVRELGGRLLISSQRGRGTEFRVRFSA